MGRQNHFSIFPTSHREQVEKATQQPLLYEQVVQNQELQAKKANASLLLQK